jgi:hypothetical protein
MALGEDDLSWRYPRLVTARRHMLAAGEHELATLTGQLAEALGRPAGRIAAASYGNDTDIWLFMTPTGSWRLKEFSGG